MPRFRDQVEGDSPGHKQNADEMSQSAAFEGSLRNHEGQTLDVSIPAASTTNQNKNKVPNGDIDGVNDTFLLDVVPDDGQIAGTLVASGVTQSLIKDVHFTLNGKQIIMNTPPALGEVPYFDFANTEQGQTLKVPHRLGKVPGKCVEVFKDEFATIKTVSATDREIELSADKAVKAKIFIEP